MIKNLKSEKILSIKVCSSSESLLLKTLTKRLERGEKTVIFTPNTQIILKAQGSAKRISLLNSSSINIPDGAGLVLASKMLGGKIKKPIGGIDIAEKILAIAEKRGYRIFLLGAKKGVAKQAKKALEKRFPNLNICGTHHGYIAKEDQEKILKKIHRSKADLLFVCMGSPIQEEWISANASRLASVKLFIGLGGSLDVWSGNIKRAPLLVRKSGFEWLYRTIKEPKRAKIFIDIPIFLFKILTSKK